MVLKPQKPSGLLCTGKREQPNISQFWDTEDPTVLGESEVSWEIFPRKDKVKEAEMGGKASGHNADLTPLNRKPGGRWQDRVSLQL